MPRASLILCSMLVGWSLFGFGCKERVDPSTILPGGLQTAPAIPERTPYVRKQLREEGPSQELLFLEQVLKNLEKATSYRLRIETANQADPTRGELLFARGKGVYATLSNNEASTHLYMTPQDSFVRYADQPWETLIGEEATALREQLFTAFGFDQADGRSLLRLNNGMKVLSVDDDPEGCKNHTLERVYYTPEKQVHRLSLCVQGAYPVRLSSGTGADTTILRYDRFDDASILQTSPLRTTP